MRSRHLRRATALALALALVGCDDGVVDPEDGGGEDAGVTDAGPPPPPPPPPTDPLARPSRSSTVAVTDDDARVLMTNPGDGSISIFTTENNERLARVATGGEPSSVVIFPGGTTAFVANRADATVVRVDGIDTGSPEVVATVEVGAEPTGLALTPNGSLLFVAEHAEGSIGVIDIQTFTRVDSIEGPQNPFALAVTNDGDDEDTDETLIAPEFFGTPTGTEGTDASREGFVRFYDVSNLESLGGLTLPPRSSGFAPDGGEPVMASPNQLHSVTIVEGRAYITSTSVSPGAPVRFNLNIQPFVYVVDIASRTEVTDPDGSANLATFVRDGTADSKLFLADTVDMAFVGEIGYALSRGADAVQRVVYEGDTIEIGSTENLQIDVLPAPAGADAGCQTPTGITTAHNGPRAYVNCWLSRRLGVINLATQSLLTTVESTSPPTDAEQIEIGRGRRFFFTGRARWSDNSWSSCSSCHPGGLTDNVTWSFPAGPRQSTSLDGSFSHGDGPQEQRIFNWTGIFDELHDFERNTRGVSGGVGAVVDGDCSSLATQTRIDLPGNLAQPIKELADADGVCTEGDWDAIDAWVRTVRPPRGRRFLDADAVARGEALFGMPDASNNNGGCVACHGGAGWTASRRFFTPSSAENTRLSTEAFTPAAMWPASWNNHANQIEVEQGIGGAGNQGPPQVACVLRNVGTFGDAPTEVRANGATAQGEGGYNVPSLYGLSVGAPFLHHGAAASLEELVSDPAFQDHLRAANPVFLTTGDVDTQRADLVAFLLSIDASTPEQPIPNGFDGCPAP